MTMALTPQEIEGKEFERRLRGYDRDAVRAFLAAVSEEMARLVGEIDRLNLMSGESVRLVEDYKARETTIQETLYAVRGLADEIKKEARRESDLIVREARIAADRLTSQAREQVTRIEEEIARLKLERDIFEDRVRSTAQEHLRLIEARQGEGEVRDRLRFLGKKPGTAAASGVHPEKTPSPASTQQIQSGAPAGAGGAGAAAGSTPVHGTPAPGKFESAS
jgi:cell division initiation protein